MGCCCTNVLPISCSVNVCDGLIDFEIAATLAGEYSLVIDFLGTNIILKKNFIEAGNIFFPANLLNESYHYVGYLLSPSGERVTKTDDEIEYDCFSFTTVLTQSEVIAEEEV